MASRRDASQRPAIPAGMEPCGTCFPVVAVPQPPLPPATSYQASGLKCERYVASNKFILRLTHMRLAGEWWVRAARSLF